MNRNTLRGVLGTFVLSAAAVAHADDVSLAGDFRLQATAADGAALSGTLFVDDDLQARLSGAAGVSSATVQRLPSGQAALQLGTHRLILAARPDGGLKVVDGGVGRLDRQGTFPAADVERAKAFLQQNAASSDHMDCITTVNHEVKILFRSQAVRVGSRQDLTMNGLVKQGLADPPRVIDYLDVNGKKTTGVTEPRTLRESVFEALRQMSGGERGWSVFGLSLLDGYHSVVLYLDQTDLENPRVYWADQWSSKGGFKEYSGAGLDEEIASRTYSWWSSTTKPRSRTTLWRLRPQAQGRVQVVSTRVKLNLRAGPGTDQDKLDVAPQGQRFQVVEASGVWRRLLGDDGQVVWAHGAFLRDVSGVPARVALPVNPGGALSAGFTAALGSSN